MAYTIEITESAEKDLSEIMEWYVGIQKTIAISFLQQFKQTITRIRKNPFKFQKRYKSVRVSFLKKFPYGVHYLTKERTITIIAIFHTSQSPGNWNRPR